MGRRLFGPNPIRMPSITLKSVAGRGFPTSMQDAPIGCPQRAFPGQIPDGIAHWGDLRPPRNSEVAIRECTVISPNRQISRLVQKIPWYSERQTWAKEPCGPLCLPPASFWDAHRDSLLKPSLPKPLPKPLPPPKNPYRLSSRINRRGAEWSR